MSGEAKDDEIAGIVLPEYVDEYIEHHRLVCSTDAGWRARSAAVDALRDAIRRAIYDAERQYVPPTLAPVAPGCEAGQGANGEVERLKDVLHKDATGLAAGLALVRAEVSKRRWIAEGRGSYEYDDDRYRKETGLALDAIDKIAEKALTASGTLAHAECCGRARPTPSPRAESRDAVTLADLQAVLPWTIHYHHDFRASPVAHKDFQHALIHVFKAAGKLAAMVNDAEHAGFDWAQDKSPDPYIADLVICALRMANTVPSRKCDLQRAVIERIESKNGVDLRALLGEARGDES